MSNGNISPIAIDVAKRKKSSKRKLCVQGQYQKYVIWFSIVEGCAGLRFACLDANMVLMLHGNSDIAAQE